MSGRRITELAVAASVDADDLLPLVDMTGTPTTRRATARQLVDGVPSLYEPNVRTADYTLVEADRLTVAVEMDVASANTVTVPPASAVSWVVGDVVWVTQVGTGQTTIVEGSGVTVDAAGGLALVSRWATVALRYRGSDVWTMWGNVTLPTGAVTVFWFDAGGDADAARPLEAKATDIVIWSNVPSEPTNLGARDQWEDAS